MLTAGLRKSVAKGTPQPSVGGSRDRVRGESPEKYLSAPFWWPAAVFTKKTMPPGSSAGHPLRETGLRSMEWRTALVIPHGVRSEEKWDEPMGAVRKLLCLFRWHCWPVSPETPEENSQGASRKHKGPWGLDFQIRVCSLRSNCTRPQVVAT